MPFGPVTQNSVGLVGSFTFLRSLQRCRRLLSFMSIIYYINSFKRFWVLEGLLLGSLAPFASVAACCGARLRPLFLKSGHLYWFLAGLNCLLRVACRASSILTFDVSNGHSAKGLNSDGHVAQELVVSCQGRASGLINPELRWHCVVQPVPHLCMGFHVLTHGRPFSTPGSYSIP